MERPDLSGQLDSATFRRFYYLKEELLRFCRENGLPTAGGKLELTERIVQFLDTGEAEALPKAKARKKPRQTGAIRESDCIEPDFICSEKHRAFFKAQIGPGFTFNVAFQRWLKANPGKTYAEAIAAYRQILAEKKQGKAEIARRILNIIPIFGIFLRLIRAKPWRRLLSAGSIKKSLPEPNRYETADLAALAE